MANTEMTVNNANAVALFAAKADWIQTAQESNFGLAFSRGSVMFPDKMIGKDAVGDNISYPYISQLTGKGVGEGQPLYSNEEALNIGNFKMAMNETWHGVLNPGANSIEQHRTYVDFEQITRKLLPPWMKRRLDTAFFYQLAGVSPNSLTIDGATYTGDAEKLQLFGHNTPVAVTSDRIVRANSAATDEALTSNDKMSLKLVQYALEQATGGVQPIEPLDDGTYDCYISPSQWVDLQNDTTNPQQWYQIELAKIQGGKKSWLDGSMGYGSKLKSAGRYGNVNFIVAPRVAYGVNSTTNAVITTVRRAVLVGKDALTFGSPFGGRMQDDNVPLKYAVEEVDYGRYRGTAAGLIYGMKRTVPVVNGVAGSSVGSIVISTYAANHS